MSLQPETVALAVMVMSEESSVLPLSANVIPVGTVAPQAAVAPVKVAAVEKPRILSELVIEEVSIDGMCGVY